jgi:CheY-like chemotaxis protein
MLERRGYTVLEARHGVDALTLWRQHRDRIDAVLTDVRMPEMSGPVLVAQLHAEAPGVPVVFMSGYVDEGATLAHGPHATFLEKPFTGEALLQALDQVLRPLAAGRSAGTG